MSVGVGAWLYALAVVGAVLAVLWGTGTRVEVWVERLNVAQTTGQSVVSDVATTSDQASPASLGRDPPSRDVDVLFYGAADDEKWRTEVQDVLAAQGMTGLVTATAAGPEAVLDVLPRAKIVVVEDAIAAACLSWMASQQAFVILSDQLPLPECEKEAVVSIPRWQVPPSIRRFVPLARSRFEVAQRIQSVFAASSWAPPPDVSTC